MNQVVDNTSEKAAISGKRNISFDVYRGWAIIIVTFGHVINMFFAEAVEMPFKVFNGTYLMPLFMSVSGYFAFRSYAKYGICNYITHRMMRVLVPVIIWCALIWTVNAGVNLLTHRPIVPPSVAEIWFLKALVFCDLVLLVQTSLFKNNPWAICLSSLVLTVGSWCFPLWLHLSWVYPFFVLGYMCNFWSPYIKKNKENLFFMSLVLLVITCQFWKWEYSPYVAHSYLFGENCLADQLYINLFTLLIGCVGCITFALVLDSLVRYFGIGGGKFIYILNVCGRKSLEIYVVQCFLLGLGRRFIRFVPYVANWFKSNPDVSMWILSPIATALLIALVLFLCKQTSKYPKLNRVLFGV